MKSDRSVEISASAVWSEGTASGIGWRGVLRRSQVRVVRVVRVETSSSLNLADWSAVPVIMSLLCLNLSLSQGSPRLLLARCIADIGSKEKRHRY